MTRIGFAGLGRMGAPMAANLARAGFQLSVWNRTPDRAARFAETTDAMVRETPRELAETSDLVITMLTDDVASSEVHDGDDGLLAAGGGATHLIEMGTLSPRHVRDLDARSAGARVVDAPVSGSVDAAGSADLMVMVGAEEGGIGPLLPALDAMSREVICLGHLGAGATAKLAVNLLIHGLNQALAESLALAETAGISRADAYRVFERSAAAAPMLGYRKPQYLDEAASPVSFALSLARKDVAVALELAAGLHVAMPQAELNLAQLRAAEEAGLGQRDMAAMVGFVGGDVG